MRVVEALWDAAEVVVGLGWAMAPMQAATVAVSAPMEEQGGLRNPFLEPTPSEEAMGLQHRVMLEDLVRARDTTPTAGLLQTMQGLRWASMLEGRLQARL